MEPKWFILSLVGEQSGVRGHLTAKSALGRYPEQFKELLQEMNKLAEEQEVKNNSKQMKMNL